MKLYEIPKNIRWTRRIFSTAIWFILAIVLPALLPLVVPLTTLYDLITRNRLSATRTVIFFAYFFVLESLGLVIAFWIWLRRLAGLDREAYEMANRRLQRWWSRGLFWGTVRIFAVNLEIEGLETLEDRRPALVFSRHASTLDTMIPLAVVREQKLYRYVIKEELLVDPALDYVAQRFPNVFVTRGGDNPELEIEKILALGTELSENTAVVVYPEGTRFSETKRKRLLEKFADDEEMQAITASLRRTLPPLREGGLRLLASTESADVVFIAHRGIDRVGAMSDLIKGGMTEANLQIRIWRIPASDVPRSEEEVRGFLLENWRRIDRFVSPEPACST